MKLTKKEIIEIKEIYDDVVKNGDIQKQNDYKGTLVITDPCYIVDDWPDGTFPDNIIEADTIYGDWGCNTFNVKTGECVGDFCADAGEVCVTTLEAIASVNPNFEAWAKKHDWCVTLIPNFEGTAKIIYQDMYNDDGKKIGEFCVVVAEDNKAKKKYIGLQTGF